MATIFQWWFFRAQRSKSCHSSLGACRDRWDRPWQLGRLGPNSSLSSTVSFAAHAAAQKLQEERGKRGHQHSWWKHPSFRWEIAWRYNNCNPKVRINLKVFLKVWSTHFLHCEIRIRLGFFVHHHLNHLPSIYVVLVCGWTHFRLFPFVDPSFSKPWHWEIRASPLPPEETRLANKKYMEEAASFETAMKQQCLCGIPSGNLT